MTERRVAIVTGASRGVGRAIAEGLIGEGFHVVGLSRGDGVALVGEYEHHAVDVADAGAVRAAVSATERAYGRIDVLISNAAAWLGALTVMTPDAEAERIIRTNVLGAFTVAREVSRVMIPARSGRIVMIGSSAVPLQMEGSALYSATKAAVVQFARVLAREVAPFGITCNVVAPSIVETEMSQQLSTQARAAVLARLAFRRPATTADVMNAVSFFVRPESAYVTGQVLYLGLVA